MAIRRHLNLDDRQVAGMLFRKRGSDRFSQSPRLHDRWHLFSDETNPIIRNQRSRDYE